ncbi:MAG: hypothetical protein HY711_02995, partial [Candidatus Melainabacteria bacterium]|nr:hypothetical protein [Candidatus Melainabacteria bacterium]
MGAEMLRLWKLAGCLMVIFYGTMFIGADAASGNESSTAWVFQTVHDCTTSGGSADLSRLRLKRSEELLGHKETGIHMPGVIPLHACCPTGVEMSVGDSQTPALMPGCIEEFGGGLHARQTDLKDPTLKGGV